MTFRKRTFATLGAALLVLAIAAPIASAKTFSNGAQVFQDSDSNEPANPYPSTIQVNGLTGPITSITPSFFGVNGAADLLDLLLVSPSGTGVVLMDQRCGVADLAAETITFADGAPDLPGNCSNLNGAYRPSGPEPGDNPFPGAAAGFGLGSTLAGYKGEQGNGTWQLFGRGNFTGGPGARLGGGWALDIETAPGCAGKTSTIAGTAGKDVLTGTAKADVFVGLAGNDTIKGLGGNDVICGGGGRDRLVGGSGKDRLIGQGGKDSCLGGGGKDTAARTCETTKSV